MSDEEEVTREEIQEEWDFIDTALETKVMDIARDFLISKGSWADNKYFGQLNQLSNQVRSSLKDFGLLWPEKVIKLFTVSLC